MQLGFLRAYLFTTLGGMFGLGLGFGWWSLLTGLVGFLLLILLEEDGLEIVGLLAVAALYVAICWMGLCTASTDWTAAGAFVLALILFLAWRGMLDTPTERSSARPSPR